MSQKREHLRQRKAEKQKQRREALRKDGKASRPGTEAGRPGVPGKRASTEVAARWTPGDAWASGNWHEQGAHVHVAVSRRREDGRLAAALFEVDLAERGVIACKVDTSLNDALLMAEVGRHSEPEPMVVVEPALALKIVLAGRDHGTANGVPQARGLTEALKLLAGIAVEDYPGDILTGAAPPAVERPRKGLVAWVSSLFKRAPAVVDEPPPAPQLAEADVLDAPPSNVHGFDLDLDDDDDTDEVRA